MTVEIRVPALGESVSEATVSKWFKAVGEAVAADEPLVELETDKVTVEVPAASAGTLSEIVATEGTNVEVGALLGAITEGAGPAAAKPKTAAAPKADAGAAPAKQPAAQAPAAAQTQAPSVRRLVAENDLDASKVSGSGKGGRLTKGDVLSHLKTAGSDSAARGPREERVRMSRLRQRIAQRLKEAQNTAAILTTFNEVDMSALLKVRADYRDTFEKKHGVRLGFMSFFAKASVIALRELPSVNAEIDGDEIVYKNYYDIGVAVSAPQGLVVPVLRDVDQLSFAVIEQSITDYGRRARDGKLAMEDLTGGTFTISNGGVFGSLLSTPIINPPQSAILGMHKIEKRPIVVNDAVVIRSMMYLALSYDHRVIDGREAVMFLVRVKECIEDPQRILLDM
ncbi:MAG: 2-oxoglutarate dehydrogenase complex dihydrolipoyllysine-residue succinyltransferase [Proteobacteria bacterium]|nr:2-oxoglutarate dehydrogenase complex dihydrolipoyllysine-residue succinyltransferase [Pseudomonadota bacterium]MDA1059391.1 2-oxoglutarate dehydrogenase complex dihydrolipoyllysine-residue succinyltransferase [Pseudomonadota bacterium]